MREPDNLYIIETGDVKIPSKNCISAKVFSYLFINQHLNFAHCTKSNTAWKLLNSVGLTYSVTWQLTESYVIDLHMEHPQVLSFIFLIELWN